MRELLDTTAVAFYLPQYHPIPENDHWWGPGFTEWANVAKARPQFRGHHQPHLPADLGFYDLRVPEVRDLQAALAERAGLGGFAYYHYWFSGRRLLERPFDEVLRTKKPDFPFFLVWANENWTRAWDGGERHVLLGQSYSLDDDLAHIRALRPALCDERYLCRDGKPVFAVYRSKWLPDPVATTDVWRREAELWGLPGLYLLRVESAADEFGDPQARGFDAAVEFQPSWSKLGQALWASRARRPLRKLSSRYSHHVFAYQDLAERAMSAPPPAYPRWPGVTPRFDNSPRRARNAHIFVGESPQVYQQWLSEALCRSREVAQRYEASTGGVVFINAWNEWAKGNYLEPDGRFGHAFLDATRAAIELAGASGK